MADFKDSSTVSPRVSQSEGDEALKKANMSVAQLQGNRGPINNSRAHKHRKTGCQLPDFSLFFAFCLLVGRRWKRKQKGRRGCFWLFCRRSLLRPRWQTKVVNNCLDALPRCKAFWEDSQTEERVPFRSHLLKAFDASDECVLAVSAGMAIGRSASLLSTPTPGDVSGLLAIPPLHPYCLHLRPAQSKYQADFRRVIGRKGSVGS